MKIPTIGPENVREVSSESTGRVVEPSRVGGAGDSLQQIGGAIQNAGDMMMQAREAMEFAQASNIADSFLAQTEQRAAQETDWSDKSKVLKYRGEIDQGIQQAANKMSTPRARQLFLARYGSRAAISNIQIQGKEHEWVVNNLKNQTELAAAQKAHDYILAPNDQSGDAIREKQLHELDEILANGLKAGLYSSPAEAAVKRKDILDKWHDAKVAYDINNNAEQALTELKKGDKGLYGGVLDAEKRLVAIEKAQQQIKFNYGIEKAERQRQEEFKKQDVLNTTIDLGNQAIANDPALKTNIENAVRQGKIDAELGYWMRLAQAGKKEWNEGMVNKKGEALTLGRGASVLVDQLQKLTSGDTAARQQVVRTAFKNYADDEKSFSGSDLAFVLRVAEGKSKDPGNPIWDKLTAAVKYIGYGRDPIVAAAMSQFQKQWDMKSDPLPVAKAVVADQHDVANPATASFKEGDIVSRGGFKYKVIRNADGSKGYERQ